MVACHNWDGFMTGFNPMYFLYIHVTISRVIRYMWTLVRDIFHNGDFCVSCVVPVGVCSYVLGAPGSGPFYNIDRSYA